MKKNLRFIISVLIVLGLSTIGSKSWGQTSQQSYGINGRQVTVVLQKLERSTSQFRNSLNAALIQGRIDQMRPENDINTFEPAFETSIHQLREQIGSRRAGVADVESVMKQALFVNRFMVRNRLTKQAQNDWAAVRTNLNTLAQIYNLRWDWNTQPPSSSYVNGSARLSDSELNELIRRVETGGDTFRSSLTEAFGQSRYDRTKNEASMNDAVRELKNETEQLRNLFDDRKPVSKSVERVLARASTIDTFMSQNRLTNKTQNDWSTLRNDINRLGGAYNLTAYRMNTGTGEQWSNTDTRLTGTFRLDASQSDNPRDTAEQATRSLSNNERKGVSDWVLARLESPEMLAIQRNRSTITLASSLAAQSTFEADGVERTEQMSNGRSNRVTATLRGDQLAVSSTGYRDTAFKVTFEPVDNGARLRVRREISSDRLSRPVVVNSVYERTSDEARWSIYSSSQPYLKDKENSSPNFILREGENVVAVLNSDLSTKQAKQGDTFSVTVRQPGQYEGAIIEGTVASVEQSGRLTGRSGMSLNFETIRLRDGQTYRFAGTLTGVRIPNGELVKVDNEGSAEGDNQTKQTATRAGIGTVVGAIIGAIAGGGKGAAIGGIIGAAGGAGSVYVQGKDNLELPSGTELTIRAAGSR